jgi:hypothetical protein
VGDFNELLWKEYVDRIERFYAIEMMICIHGFADMSVCVSYKELTSRTRRSSEAVGDGIFSAPTASEAMKFIQQSSIFLRMTESEFGLEY